MNREALQDSLHVPAGTDRFGENGLSIWGLLPLATKLSGKDTDGQLFIFEHRDQGKGGPPRHVHHEHDEWFYVVKGEYAFEIGDRKFRATAGDSVLAPRHVPHGWACISDEPGTLLTIVSPVGTFEAFLRETTAHATLPPADEVARAFTEGGMTVVGPPLEVH